jgi:hypothetical protein
MHTVEHRLLACMNSLTCLGVADNQCCPIPYLQQNIDPLGFLKEQKLTHSVSETFTCCLPQDHGIHHIHTLPKHQPLKMHCCCCVVYAAAPPVSVRNPA